MATLNVVVDRASGCFLWQGATDADGYGVVRVGRRTMRAHRWAYEVETGRKLDRLHVLLHTCDTPACINVAHLRVGTQEENLRDRDAKGRAARGAANAATKLSEEQRALIVGSWAPAWKLAGEFGVDRATIDALRLRARRGRWR